MGGAPDDSVSLLYHACFKMSSSLKPDGPNCAEILARDDDGDSDETVTKDGDGNVTKQ